MNWAGLAANHDWQELWGSDELRKRLERHGMQLLEKEGPEADRARGALEMAHFLMTLPTYESQRRLAQPIERVPLRGWLMTILGKTLTDLFGKAPKEGGIRVRI